MIVRPTEVSPNALRIFQRLVSKDINLSVEDEGEMQERIQNNEALLYMSVTGALIGGVGYTTGRLPPSDNICLVERLLYTRPGSTGLVAMRLLQGLEKQARWLGCDTILAGSSLNHNEATRRLYEHAGFKTNYSFRKDL